MPLHNEDIAAVFDEIADLLEVLGSNPFRIRAYRNAARTIRDSGREIARLSADGGDLTAIPGIGADLAAKIVEMVESGKVGLLEELRARLPRGILDLLKIPGLGPKRVKILHEKLKIDDLAQLKEACEGHRVRDLPGFGAKSEEKIIQAIAAHADSSRRFLRATAMSYVNALLEYLQGVKGVKRVSAAGSYRRGRETVGDLDILVVSAARSAVMERFVAYDEVAEVLSRGTTRSSVILRSGLQVDLRVVSERSYGAALHYFTGSKAHNIAVRRLGQKKGLKINEYGIFKGGKYVGGRREEEVFGAVGLPFIPPELREDRGEIEAAGEGRLPVLVEPGDMRGDLHMHTSASDGHTGIPEMAAAARRLGYRYIAITEHSKRLTIAHGLDEDRLRKQIEEIDRVNEKLSGITILKGIEVDILEDGSLDLSDEVLGLLDLVIGAVHSHFGLSREKQTARIMKAMDRPHFSILAHPTGRLLTERGGYDVDMARIIHHAAERGCFMELNAHPRRLDLDDVHCQLAKSEGVLVAVNTDSHRPEDLKFMEYGVGQARRGWLEKSDILNTRGLRELRSLLARTM